MKKETVIRRRCSEYDPGKVSTIIGEGIEAFGLAPRIKGKVTIKPNVVFAPHKVAPSAYARSEFMDELLGALEHKASSDAVFTFAEKCGAAIPTSRMFRHAGYYKLKKKHRVRVVPIEEAKKVRAPLAKGVLHKDVCMSRDIAQRDFLVYAPKHKTIVLWLFLKAGILNPPFRPGLIIDSYFFDFLSWMRRIVKERL